MKRLLPFLILAAAALAWSPPARAISDVGMKVFDRLYFSSTSGTYLENDGNGIAFTDSASNVGRLFAKAWEDLRVPMERARPAAVSPAWATFIDNTKAWKFDTGEYVMFAVQLPHAWEEGSTIDFHAHWSAEDGNSGNVTLELQYTLASIGGTFPSTTTISDTFAVAEVANRHQMSEIGDITMTGHTVSAVMQCRFGRIATDDTYGSEIYVHEVDFHYVRDANGSQDEDDKW